MMGYIGDTYGSRRALTISIFLMAFPTFAMGVSYVYLFAYLVYISYCRILYMLKTSLFNI